MSYSFYVDAGPAPRYEDVLGALPAVDTSAGEIEALEGPWEPGHVLAAWRPGLSTRPVELAFEGSTFSARVLACSCAEDYELALDAVCHVARTADAEVESEEGVRFAPSDREAHYGRAWIDPHVASMVRVVLAQAADADGYLTMPGPTRDFHVGPRVAGEIGDGSPEAQRDALFAKMRALFYPDPEELYAANVLSVTTDDGTRFTTTALAPGVSYLFPQVDYLTILGRDPFEIRFASLPEVVGEDRLTWMDEVCPAIEAIGEDDWPAVEARAREHAVDPRGRQSLPGAAPPPPAAEGLPWGLIAGVLLALAVVIWVLTR